MDDPRFEEAQVEVTEASLRGYMNRRAAVCPLARTVLLWTHFQVTIQAMQVFHWSPQPFDWSPQPSTLKLET